LRPLVVIACGIAAGAGCGKGTTRGGPEAGIADGATSPTSSSSSSYSPEEASTGAQASACPDDMAYVKTSFCPRIDRRCLDMEHEKTNHLDICHAFAHEESCLEPERPIAFCIDRYEYPDRKGAHPVWMLTWFEAQATCESKGKRLCLASEWTAACEGPEHTPFPYGWERDHDKCNMDSFYVDPRKPGPHAQFLFYAKDPDVAFKELTRLDQSIPSGSMESCRSGFGVYDMPGNLDEWVVSDVAPREKSMWAGLKGGAWGHVRSQCRPMTFSHAPDFRYYFVGFRCCRDAAGSSPEEKWTPSPEAASPPAVDPHDFAPEPLVVTGAPGPSRTKFSRTGRAE
jgi:hypothetical protein